MALGMEVGLGPSDIVLNGDPALPSKKRRSTAPQYSTDVCCGQRAGWINIPLGMEVGLRPGHTVRWGPSSPLKRAQPPLFGPCLLWPNGWMDQDATWYEGKPQAGQHCVTCGHSSTPQGAQQPPSFRPMSIVATVAHLSCCCALVLFAVNFPAGKMPLGGFRSWERK